MTENKIKIFGLFEVDLNKIPRPERSGYMSVLIGLIFFQLLFAPIGGDSMSLRCLLIECSKPETNAEVLRDYKYIYLFPDGKGKHPCVCHLDLRWKGDFVPDGEVVEHIVDLNPAPTCETEPTERREWHDEYTYLFSDGKMDTREIRWHCDDEKILP